MLSGLSFIRPKLTLQLWHNMPRTLLLEWQWSMRQSRLPGSSVRHIAHRLPCEVRSALYSSGSIPYLFFRYHLRVWLRVYSRVASGSFALAFLLYSRTRSLFACLHLLVAATDFAFCSGVKILLGIFIAPMVMMNMHTKQYLSTCYRRVRWELFLPAKCYFA